MITLTFTTILWIKVMLRDVTDCPTVISREEYWQYGRIIGIPVNMLGFLCGMYIVHKYF